MPQGLYFGMEPGDFDFVNPGGGGEPDPISLERALQLKQAMDAVNPVLSGFEPQPEPLDYGRLPDFGTPDMSQEPGPPSTPQMKAARKEAGVYGPTKSKVMLGLEALSNALAVRARSKARKRGQQQPAMPGYGYSMANKQRKAEGQAKVKAENERRGKAEVEGNRKALDSYQQRKAATLRSVLPTVARSIWKDKDAGSQATSLQEIEAMRQMPEFQALPKDEQAAAILRNLTGNPPADHEGRPPNSQQEIEFARQQSWYKQMTPEKQAEYEQSLQRGTGQGGSPWLDRMLADQILKNKDPMGLGRDTVPLEVAKEKALRDMEAIKGAMKPRPSFANVEAGGSTGGMMPPGAAPTHSPPAAAAPQGATPPPGPHLRNAPPELKNQALMGYQNAVRANPAAAEALRQDFLFQFGFDPEQGQ